jgi:hypothetical protein
LYTAANQTVQNITGVGFQPDWVWLKDRSSATWAHNLFDAVRGVNLPLSSDLTNAESTRAGTLTSFNSDGFSLGTDSSYAGTNIGTDAYVAWNWKANGSGSSNTAGSITSTVSASTTSGFSIVTYTGNGVDNATIGHGLGVAPYLLIGKVRSTTGGWPVWINVSGFGANDFLALNSTDAKNTAVTLWGGSNASVPTSTVFKVGNNASINGSGSTYVVYCFAPVAGYSAFGSYTGNGSADGPFVFTGFRPAYVLIKNTTSGAGPSWQVRDSARIGYNSANYILYSNLSNAEYSSAGNFEIDFLSNGFKIRTATDAGCNGSGDTMIYAAFATAPFKFSLAR